MGKKWDGKVTTIYKIDIRNHTEDQPPEPADPELTAMWKQGLLAYEHPLAEYHNRPIPNPFEGMTWI